MRHHIFKVPPGGDMHELLRTWQPEEVAEYWQVDRELYGVLWDIANEQRTIAQAGDSSHRHAPTAHFWDRFTPEQKAKLNLSAADYDDGGGADYDDEDGPMTADVPFDAGWGSLWPRRQEGASIVRLGPEDFAVGGDADD